MRHLGESIAAREHTFPLSFLVADVKRQRSRSHCFLLLTPNTLFPLVWLRLEGTELGAEASGLCGVLATRGPGASGAPPQLPGPSGPAVYAAGTPGIMGCATGRLLAGVYGLCSLPRSPSME